MRCIGGNQHDLRLPVIIGAVYLRFNISSLVIQSEILHNNILIWLNTVLRAGNVPVKIMDNVASVYLGGYHSAAMTSRGDLYIWGENHFGEPGDGTTEDSLVPIQLNIPKVTDR